ncbi:tripartite tricarboxylate transporter permease [Devosia naphthalenivorans]|uniref:tripartite tricarboxylate transporter permease n=1 Tax=Devosia naphthalenivorans TaxID=2082392 RepID=UPI000D3528A3|nr:tripartite tricarboxylate transporter permease [Devosia naphthalenivorans]
MTSIFDSLIMGFTVAITPVNLLYALIGCVLGTMIGVLPGIGSLATISMLLSFSSQLDAVTSLIMMAGIFYGAQYGSSTTAILCNIPGDAASVVTCLDGHQMARKGRAGQALAIAALSSLLAGIIATIIIGLFTPPIARFALNFNAPEYFSLMVLGLVACVVFSNGSVLNAFIMAAFGVLLGCIGTDVETGAQRYTFGVLQLSEGITIVAVAMGLFGLSEIVVNLANGNKMSVLDLKYKMRDLWPSKAEFRAGTPAALRGTFIGALLGILPGAGQVLSPFASYMIERRLSKKPGQFGEGAVEGLAGPEAANNAAAQTSFIPLLALGIPANPVIALMLGAMVIQGIQPGPNVMVTRPEVVWGLIASMFIGNLMLVIINLPMIGVWVRLLAVPQRILFPAIVVFCCIGIYTLSGSVYDLVALAAFAAIGVLFYRAGFQAIPLLLGFILGPMLEENLRRAMVISQGDLFSLFQRPISATVLSISILLLLMTALPSFRKQRENFAGSD